MLVNNKLQNNNVIIIIIIIIGTGLYVNEIINLDKNILQNSLNWHQHESEIIIISDSCENLSIKLL